TIGGIYSTGYRIVDIHDSNIENGGFDVYLDHHGPKGIDASENWWGTTDPFAIDAAVYDCNDDPTAACVEVLPISKEPRGPGSACGSATSSVVDPPARAVLDIAPNPVTRDHCLVTI